MLLKDSNKIKINSELEILIDEIIRLTTKIIKTSQEVLSTKN
jgi:hypothetical protein